MKHSALILIMTISLLSCVREAAKPTVSTISYDKEIKQWHAERNDRLNQPDGWLTLSGLFWLTEGENTFGGSHDNDLVFPGGDVAPHLGTFLLYGDSVSLQVAEGIEMMMGDSLIDFSGLKKDSSGDPDLLKWGTLTWYIIERGDRIGVRLKDAAHPAYVNFKPTELFPIDKKWRVEASLETFDSLRTVDIVNVLGDTSPSTSPGVLHFEMEGQALTLTPLGLPEDESYFIIFGDKTNGITTYGAGRFLVVPAADENGRTTIDFNKSYNMPCVFSPYATCPLPPEENLLPVAILAGEQDYKTPYGH
jgi:uncharacterized protein (DUF1684 family)